MSEDKNSETENTKENSQAMDGQPERPPSDSNLELARLNELVEKHKSDYLYLRAEFDNYKRHAIKERADLLKYGGERIANDLLEVMDNIERALETKISNENLDTFYKGVQMTAQSLKGALEKHGIVEIDSSGKPFDPALHEALSSEPTDAVAPGHISRVFRKPYKYHDKIVRPGQVVVAKKPE